jgi:NADH:ubiquinone oxidoreductase subunit E
LITVTVCVGSACHVRGSRKFIESLDALLKEHKLQDKVELKGAFCMELCAEGINWKIGDEVISSETVEAAVDHFKSHVFDKLDE